MKLASHSIPLCRLASLYAAPSRWLPLLLLLLAQPEAGGTTSPAIQWSSQFGTLAYDDASGAVTDADGYLYVLGSTSGLIGSEAFGNSDYYLSKYDPDGSLLWSRQYGGAYVDVGAKLSYDSIGHLYVTGRTSSDLGGPWAGGYDAYIAKFDLDGSPIWTRQFGTTADDYGSAITTDSAGSVYVSGRTDGSLAATNAGGFDAFVTKYSSDGVQQWIKQFGTSSWDESFGVAVDSQDRLLVTGNTQGALDSSNRGSQDMFTRWYDADGVLLGSEQFGTGAWDKSFEAAVDEVGNTYFVGYTRGHLVSPNAGQYDTIVYKYDSDGDLAWIRQFGTSEYDYSYSIAAHATNGVVIGGERGVLDQLTGGPENGAFVAKLSPDGELLWDLPAPSTGGGFVFGLAYGEPGSVYAVGATTGDLFGANQGSYDGFVFKLADVPEPTTCILLGLCSLGSLRIRSRRCR